MSRLRNRFALALLLSAVVAVSANAQDEKKQEKKDDSSEQKTDEPKTLIEIRAAISKGQSEALKGYRSAKAGSMEQKKALDAYYAVPEKYTDKIVELVKADPTNSVGAGMLMSQVRMTRNIKVRNKLFKVMFDIAKSDMEKGASSFNYLMLVVTGPSRPMLKSEAQALLIKNYADSEKMADVAMNMSRAPASDASVDLLRNLIEKSPHDSVKGASTYALGKMLSGSPKTKKEGIELIKSIPKKFADVTIGPRKTNLAKMVEGEIFELEKLQIGMAVPDIQGEDVDGVEFKLSDYKGKVVVIDFWGDW